MIVLFASSCVPARDNFKKVPLSDKITLLVWANAGSSFMAFAKEGFMILLLCVSFSLNYLLLYQKKRKRKPQKTGLIQMVQHTGCLSSEF